MRTRAILALAAGAAAGVAASFSLAQTGSTQAAGIERGRYLVHEVAMCVQCHTPRDQQGRLIMERQLEGAPIPVASPYPGMAWAFESAPLAGLPGFTQQDLITLLTTGARPDGRVPRPPMPPFRLSRSDAAARRASASARSR